MRGEIAAADRESLYFEMGHQFDWGMLTRPERRYLAREWGRPRVRWWDTRKALDFGEEDGLEAYFAQIYADCAEGINDKSATLAIWVPFGESHLASITPRIDTCRFIQRVAAR